MKRRVLQDLLRTLNSHSPRYFFFIWLRNDAFGSPLTLSARPCVAGTFAPRVQPYSLLSALASASKQKTAWTHTQVNKTVNRRKPKRCERSYNLLLFCSSCDPDHLSRRSLSPAARHAPADNNVFESDVATPKHWPVAARPSTVDDRSCHGVVCDLLEQGSVPKHGRDRSSTLQVTTSFLLLLVRHLLLLAWHLFLLASCDY